MQAILFTTAHLLYQLQSLFFRPAITLLLPLLHGIKRRRRDIKITVLDNRPHITEKESHDQRGNMRSIDIGIGHNNNFMITYLLKVFRLAILGRTYRDSQCLEYDFNFFTLPYPVGHRFLNVQYFSAQRQYSLKTTIPSLFGRTPRRISFDQKYLTILRVIIGTIS